MRISSSIRRRMKSVLGICAVLLVFNVSAAMACLCEGESPKRTIRKLRKTATVIVSGTVTEVTKERKDGRLGYWATLKVKQSWKSDRVEEIRVYTTGGCKAWFEAGRTYMVYAQPDAEGRLSTSVCMRTRLIELAADDLKLLGKPQFAAETPGP
jgi:hypothetical protein